MSRFMRSQHRNRACYTKIENDSASRAIYLPEHSVFVSAHTHSLAVHDASRASVVHHVHDEAAAARILRHHAIIRILRGTVTKCLVEGALLMLLALTSNVVSMLLSTHRSSKRRPRRNTHVDHRKWNITSSNINQRDACFSKKPETRLGAR